MDMPPYEDFLKQTKNNLWFCGTPYGDSRIYLRFYFIYIFLIVMISAEVSFFITQISTKNILELTQLAPCVCIGTLSLLQIIALTQKRSEIFELTEKLSILYNSIIHHDNTKNLIKRDFILLKGLTKYFFILNAVLISVYNFYTLFSMAYHYKTTKEIVFSLPYAVLLPFSTDSWLPWSVAYVYSITCGFICTLYFTTVDVLYCILTSHVCANFTVISYKIERLNKNNVHLLKEIVTDHQFILGLAEILENIFTAPNLFSVLIGSLEICALGFNLMTGELTKIPGFILFLSSVLLQILMMSVFGEKLINESRKVGEAAFLCKWYEMDVASRKNILTIMTRAHKAQKLTAYKFSVISYASFTKIISTSWSYFTILRTVYEPSQN